MADLKKQITQAAAQQPRRKRESLGAYFKGVRKEMGKVAWPTRKELGTYTIVVIATCAVFAAAFWLIDIGVLAFERGVLGIR